MKSFKSVSKNAALANRGSLRQLHFNVPKLEGAFFSPLYCVV